MTKKKLPETSLAANRAAVIEMRSQHQAKIIQALKSLGNGIYEELAQFAGMEKNQVSRRLKELELLGIVFKPGAKKPTKSGREAFVYQLTGDSQPKTDAEAKSISNAANPNEKTEKKQVSTIKYREQDMFA